MLDKQEELLTRADMAGVRWLTLNRPGARNALNVALMNGLISGLDAAEADPQVRVVVIAGAGQAFCAGHDLRELRAITNTNARQELFALCSRLMMRIIDLTKPVIARVHGVATAAGCQLVATCDLAVATDDARFATPGVNIGLFCSTPAVALSRSIGRKAAMEMLLTGEMISARRAVEIGLINRTVPRDGDTTPYERLDREVQAIGESIAAKSEAVVALGKKVFRRQVEMDVGSAYTFASDGMARNLAMEDAAEGIDAFLERRRPEWRGK